VNKNGEHKVDDDGVDRPRKKKSKQRLNKIEVEEKEEKDENKERKVDDDGKDLPRKKKSKQRINKIEVEEKEVKDEVETSDKKTSSKKGRIQKEKN